MLGLVDSMLLLVAAQVADHQRGNITIFIYHWPLNSAGAVATFQVTLPGSFGPGGKPKNCRAALWYVATAALWRHEWGVS